MKYIVLPIWYIIRLIACTAIFMLKTLYLFMFILWSFKVPCDEELVEYFEYKPDDSYLNYKTIIHYAIEHRFMW